MNYKEIYVESKKLYNGHKKESIFFSAWLLLSAVGFIFLRGVIKDFLEYLDGFLFGNDIFPNTVLFLLDFAALLFFVPFGAGLFSWIIKRDSQDLFSFFQEKERLQRMYRHAFAVLYYFVLCFSPMLVVFLVFNHAFLPVFLMNKWYIFFIIFVILLFLSFYLFFSMIKIPYFLITQPQMGVKEAVKISRSDMKGKKAEFARLLLAFAPLLLGGIFTGFTLWFFCVFPRMGFAYTIFCEQSNDRKGSP